MNERFQTRLAVIIAAGAVLLASLALAQPPRRGDGEGRPHMRDRFDQRLIEFLDLTEDQQEAWRAAHQEHRDAVSGVMTQLRDNREALEQAIEAEDALRVGELTLEGRRLHEQVRASAEALRGELEGVLDAEQRERWEAFREARGHGHGPGFGRRGHRGPRGAHGAGGDA
jgi:Spy/CpxP family protein refolding chaperone